MFVQFPGSYIAQSSKNTEIYWGHSSIVEAEFLCLQDLLHNNKSWQYAIDLTGSEVEAQLSYKFLTCSSGDDVDQQGDCQTPSALPGGDSR